MLERPDRRLEAVVCNLSVLGVYVTFFHPVGELPEDGETVRISFPAPGDDTPLEADARVTWQNLSEPDRGDGLPLGCGLRFLSLSPRDHHRIGVLVHEYRYTRQPRSFVPRPYSGFPRVPCIRPALVASGDDTWEGVLCNLSVVGAYVALDAPPPAGRRVRLCVKLTAGPSTEIDAEVAWINGKQPRRARSLPPGCGLRFVDLSESQRARLDSVIGDYDELPRPGLE